MTVSQVCVALWLKKGKDLRGERDTNQRKAQGNTADDVELGELFLHKDAEHEVQRNVHYA